MRCILTLDFHNHTPTEAAIAEEFGRVATMIAEGYREGEIIDYHDANGPHRGWWTVRDEFPEHAKAEV